MKTILAGSMDDTNLEQMFLEEASLASQVHHPNVVEILDLGEHEGTLYLVMEWVDGESLQLVLKQMVGRGPLPFSIAVNIVGQACKGLHEAHELRDSSGQLVGLVHRDVSPHNILLSYSGVVKIVDFGIAKATNKNSGLTEDGHVKGKSAFMSPEQMRSKPIDRRADIFAMGIVLYLVTTGRHPFRGQDAIQTMRNVCEKPPVPPGSLVKDYPAKLSEVVLRALAKDPTRRFSTAYDMLSALEEAVPGCLEASFERDVANFLSELFGDRAAQRRAALAEAQEQADRVLELEGGSTQRAWLAGGTRGSSRVKLPSDEFGFARSVRRKHLIAVAGAAATLLVGAGVLALRSGSKDETERAGERGLGASAARAGERHVSGSAGNADAARGYRAAARLERDEEREAKSGAPCGPTARRCRLDGRHLGPANVVPSARCRSSERRAVGETRPERKAERVGSQRVRGTALSAPNDQGDHDARDPSIALSSPFAGCRGRRRRRRPRRLMHRQSGPSRAS